MSYEILKKDSNLRHRSTSDLQNSEFKTNRRIMNFGRKKNPCIIYKWNKKNTRNEETRKKYNGQVTTKLKLWREDTCTLKSENYYT